MSKNLLPVKSDFIFKLIFGDQRNVDILGENDNGTNGIGAKMGDY